MNNETQPYISFFIPCYNEEKNVQHVFDRLYEVLKQKPDLSYEILVTNDCSTDGTLKVLEGAAEKDAHMRVINHKHNLAYCGTLKEIVKMAHGKYIMYVSADQEFDCLELPAFLEKLGEGCDLVLGVRWQRNAYPLGRLLLSVIYIFLLNYLFKVRFNDYNWIQIWPARLFREIELKSKSLFVLPELILKAHDLGYRIGEVPSDHRGRTWGKSSSSNFFVMLHALIEALTYRRKGRKEFQAHRGPQNERLPQRNAVPV